MITFLIFLYTAVLFPLDQPSPADMSAFVQQLNRALETRDISAYLSHFSEDIREDEQIRIQGLFDDLSLESGAMFLASQQETSVGGYTLYVRLFLQNSTLVILDLLRLEVINADGAWTVIQKFSMGDTQTLYKVSLPSQRIEKVESFVLEHEDIRISFEDALCFYDNIPELETALIVIGKGRLEFSPSLPREQHQLELFFKQKTVVDKLEHAYLRFSPSFFKNNISIVQDEAQPLSIPESEVNKAYSIFMRHYPHSFTVRNSLNGELSSVMPQGDEAVFDFKGKKVGDSTYIYSPFSSNEISFYQWKEGRMISLYSPPSGGVDKRMFISFRQQYDVLNYELDIEFEPDQFLFAGKARIEVKANVDKLDSLKFCLNPTLQILRISDSEKRELYYTEDKLRSSVYIYFVRPPLRGQTAMVEVYYRGKIEPPPLSADVIDVQMDQTFQASRIRFDALLYSRSSTWYPAPDNVDFFQARLKIITPPRYQVIANGILEGEYHLENLADLEDVRNLGNAVHVFQTQNPVKYLSFIVGHLEKRREETSSIPLQYYRAYQTFPEKWDIFEGAQEILQFYQDLFGDYPFEKLCLVRRLWESAGGHSPASFIVLNDLPQNLGVPLKPTSDSPVDLSRWKEYFLAHEIAHQWWGQGLAWQTYGDQWLSEGMAQFATIQYLKKKYGDRTYRQILEKFSNGIKKRSKWGGITMGTRLSYSDFEAYQTIVYNKTALVMNMLKDILGEEVFYTGLKQFYTRYRYRAASTQDFFHAFKELTSLDLDAFFEMWFNSHLLPDVRVTHTLHHDPDSYRLRLSVTQNLHKFVFPLWLEWVEQGLKVRKLVIVDNKEVNYEIRIPHKPEKIRINPDKSVPGEFRYK